MNYPRRLHHDTPGWVKDSASFHIRIRADRSQSSLIDLRLAADLLAAAKRYHDSGYWWCDLFLLMPDHLHAILSFPRERTMSQIIRQWKRGTARSHGVRWQEGYFDHRLRNDHEYAEKWGYILRNPVAKNLCTSENEWPWRWSGLTSRRLP